MIKLNIGSNNACLAGWDNIDKYEHTGVIVHDARSKFPYPDNSVDYIFSEHFIEHLTAEEALIYFKECYRMLKKGGVVRTSTFDFDNLITECRTAETWNSYKYKLYDGQFANYDRMQFLNFAIYEGGAHKCMYNIAELVRALQQSNFNNFAFHKMRESLHAELQNKEWRCNSDCIVEATK